MADAICRWRNPYLPTVMELIEILPKEELSQERAREIVNNKSPYDFYRTPYQLACQLGLYHETGGKYFPKFTYTPTEQEVLQYLTNWIIHYTVPNPYTKDFDGLGTFSIHAELSAKLLAARADINYEATLSEIFQEDIGNKDILANSITSYSPVISIKNNIISLKSNKVYRDLVQYLNVDVLKNRDNREYFFDLFSLHNVGNLNADHQDINLIKEIQALPNLTQTEKKQIISARIGQGYFRRNLVLECDSCPLTLVNDSRLLVASHIKPWKISDNHERLNPKNGILLTPTYDKLFDNGLISFTNDRKLIVSPLLSDFNINRLNLSQNMDVPALPVDGREIFLEYHRDIILKTK